MRKSIIKLTKEEFDFISRDDYPKIKHRVIQKICQHFDALGILLQQSISSKNETVMIELNNAQYKTTRGENYQLLPYVVLDYPRIKGPEFIIACRTMFWWGNYFSLNVLLFAPAFDRKKLISVLHHPSFDKVKLYTGNDVWQQDLDHSDFVKLGSIRKPRLDAILKKQSYIKLSVKIPLKKWNELDEKAVKFYNSLLHQLS